MRDTSGRLEHHVETLLTCFLEEEITLHLKLERIKQQLHERFDWQIVDIFNQVDCTHDGFVNHNNPQKFLRK